MNAPLREQKAAQKLMIVDCDIHPIQRSAKDLYPFLSKHWREHLETFGGHVRQGLIEQTMWPRMMAAGQRADAYPAQGGPPGSDFELMKRQHLDVNGVEFGMLVALSKGGMEERNPDLARALSSAVNDWQLEAWVKRDARLKAGIVVTGEDPAHAVAEIEKRAGDPSFAQVILSPRSSEPLGRRKCWPIYAAAVRAGLPVGLHPAAIPGGSETLLVVEDDIRVRRVAVNRLHAMGYEVIEAGSGAEALAVLEARSDIDLLFTDVVMPGGMLGGELAREVRRSRPDLKILFTSGYAEPGIAGKELAETGSWLKKPYTAMQLAVRLRELLDPVPRVRA